MDPHLELLPRLLVDVQRPEHGVLLDVRRQQDGTRNYSSRSLGRLNNLADAGVEDAVVVSAEPDADSLLRITGLGHNYTLIRLSIPSSEYRRRRRRRPYGRPRE